MPVLRRLGRALLNMEPCIFSGKVTEDQIKIASVRAVTHGRRGSKTMMEAQMRLDIIVGVIGVLTAFAAGAFWLWASLIPVPDNLDTFISDIQRISQINAYGAGCACVAAICGAYAFARTIV